MSSNIYGGFDSMDTIDYEGSEGQTTEKKFEEGAVDSLIQNGDYDNILSMLDEMQNPSQEVSSQKKLELATQASQMIASEMKTNKTEIELEDVPESESEEEKPKKEKEKETKQKKEKAKNEILFDEGEAEDSEDSEGEDLQDYDPEADKRKEAKALKKIGIKGDLDNYNQKHLAPDDHTTFDNTEHIKSRVQEEMDKADATREEVKKLAKKFDNGEKVVDWKKIESDKKLKELEKKELELKRSFMNILEFIFNTTTLPNAQIKEAIVKSFGKIQEKEKKNKGKNTIGDIDVNPNTSFDEFSLILHALKSRVNKDCEEKHISEEVKRLINTTPIPSYSACLEIILTSALKVFSQGDFSFIKTQLENLPKGEYEKAKAYLEANKFEVNKFHDDVSNVLNDFIASVKKLSETIEKKQKLQVMFTWIVTVDDAKSIVDYSYRPIKVQVKDQHCVFTGKPLNIGDKAHLITLKFSSEKKDKNKLIDYRYVSMPPNEENSKDDTKDPNYYLHQVLLFLQFATFTGSIYNRVNMFKAANKVSTTENPSMLLFTFFKEGRELVSLVYEYVTMRAIIVELTTSIKKQTESM